MFQVLLILLFLIPSWTLAQEQETPSLAELARKERQRRASSGKVIPVITNATLRGSTRGQAPPLAAVASGESQATQETASGADGRNQAEEWEGAFGATRLDLETAEAKGRVLELKMNDLGKQFYSQSNGVTQGRIQEQLQEAEKELDENKKAIESARLALQQLQQEARKAGVLPGKLRELSGGAQ